MADTQAVPWSPFAPPAPETESQVQSELEPPPATSVDPKSGTESSSTLFTLHSENTPEKAEPQVATGAAVEQTLHSPPNSPPTSGHSESHPEGEEPTENVTVGDSSSDEELTFKAASRAWLLGVGERVQPLVRGLRPPTVWTEPPASLRDLCAYADTAPWADEAGPIRMAGRVWCWTVAVPISTVFYYGCWLTQRPSRLLTLLTVYALVAHTSFGSWLPWVWATT